MPDSHFDQNASEGAFSLFCEAWTRHLANTISSILGEQAELIDNDKPVSTAPDYWFYQAFPPLGGSLCVGLDRDGVVCLGTGLLKAAPAGAEVPERAVQSFVEILSQAAAGMASQLSSRYKSEVRAGALTNSGHPPRLAQHARQLLLVTGAGSYPVSIVITEGELLLPFGPGPSSLPAACPPTEAHDPSTAVDQIAVNTRNLDLLLDVELPISVSFGRAQLPLKDVIKLTTGSIVELNRSVSEPVDIIVNNCTIARGEVVVVEGNFGVRIKQIVSKQERLRSVT